MSRTCRVVALVLVLGVTACGLLTGQLAPEECGFPDGTTLSFAGRSTTSALGVQEVVGDPMSDDPADIYVTRDQFDQGDLHGRLVCTIYINQPGFVEITVHPDDVPPVVEEPEPLAPEPPDGISREDAVDAARDVVLNEEAWEVTVVEAGPAGEIIVDMAPVDWAHEPAPDAWVWRVFLVSGDQGTDVYVDYVDGNVLGTVNYIVN